MFEAHIVQLCEYGFPISILDLRMITGRYLASSKHLVPSFRDNYPGKDWVNMFMDRHERLSHRSTGNISLARAAVDDNTIDTYMNHLDVTIAGVPANNIFKYDEPNFSDDPR